MKQHIFLFLSLFSIVNLSKAQNTPTDLPVQDTDFSCLSDSKAQQYIADFHINTASFGGVELCNSAVDSKKLFNDLQIIEEGRFIPLPGSHLLIGSFVDSEKYYSWLKEQTNSIERGNDVPYATAYNSNGNFTLQDGWAKLSILGRVGTIIHEARHTAGYTHMPCHFGPYADSNIDACDQDFASGGSHAVEMEYYARVAVLGTNFHPAYKAMARLMAVGRANFVFNKSPIQKRQGVLGITKDHNAVLWNGSEWLQRAMPLHSGKLKQTSFGASLFSGVEAFSIDLYENYKWSREISDDYSYFKLLKQDRGQGPDPIIDFEEFDSTNKRYAVFMNDRGEISNYNFPLGKWNTKISLPPHSVEFKTQTPAGIQGIFIKTSEGDIYQINPENLQQQTKLAEKWPEDIVQTITWDKKPVNLDREGKLTGINTPLLFEAITNVPLYDAFEVKP